MNCLIKLSLIGAVVMLPSACTKKTSEPTSLVDEGRKIYVRNCIACHNVEINKDGAVGPAVAGSSLELLEHRVLSASYPPGYTPKRTTHNMVPLPFLKPDIPALHAYLNSK